MGKFKRFCMIVFALLPCWAWAPRGPVVCVEPLFPAIAWLMGMPWFFIVEAVLLGITRWDCWSC